MADWDFYLVTGTVDHSTLIAASSNNLENLPAYYFASDKAPNWVWMPPDRELTTLPRRPEYVMMLDMSQKAHGLYYFQWGFKFLPWGPLARITNKLGILSGSLGTHPSLWLESALCTIKTPVVGNYTASTKSSGLTYGVYNCTVLKPIPGEHMKLETGGARDVIFRFVGGTDVT